MDAETLSTFDLFEGLSDEELSTYAAMFTEQRVLMGEKLTEEDDFGYSFFLVLDGNVKVTVEGDPVAELSAGDHFGELALVRGDRRNAQVTATESCRLAKMMTWDFNDLLEEHPELAGRLEAIATERDS